MGYLSVALSDTPPGDSMASPYLEKELYSLAWFLVFHHLSIIFPSRKNSILEKKMEKEITMIESRLHTIPHFLLYLLFFPFPYLASALRPSHQKSIQGHKCLPCYLKQVLVSILINITAPSNAGDHFLLPSTPSSLGFHRHTPS